MSEASRCKTLRSAPRSRALSAVDRSMPRDSASSASAVATASAMPNTSSSVRVGRRKQVAIGKQRQRHGARLARDAAVGNPAVPDMDPPIGPRGERLVMRHQHQCHAGLGAQRQQQLDDRRRIGAVEIAGRLVRQQQLRPVGEAAGDRHALALAAGQRKRQMA